MHVTASLASLALVLASTSAFADDTVSVRIASDDGPIVVETRADAGWKVACTDICDQPLPLDAQYRVKAEGGGRSEPFYLMDKEDVTLAVRSHHNGRFVAGVVLTAFGGVVLGASTASALLALALASAGSFMSIPFAFGAMIGGVAGTATLVPGIILMTHGSSTRVEQAETAVPMLSMKF